MFRLVLGVLLLPAAVSAVRCFDCSGDMHCMGSFCEGEYCVLSTYAPRWGSQTWGQPTTVQGCISGTMMEEKIQDHCEVADDDEREIFTCFCNKNNCNSGNSVKKLKKEPVELVTCECKGEHCPKGESTCVGELCSWVKNHKTGEIEQGCVNASVPLIERRSVGSCMMPPITGAMHHSVAKTAEDLLTTESCVCARDYCNEKQPVQEVKENTKCYAMIDLVHMGNKATSRNISCKGEYCFKASIKSKLGYMTEYRTMGCATFHPKAVLAEELQATGCAKFQSESLEVEACYRTDDENVKAKARRNQEARKNSRRTSQKGRKGERRPSKYEREEEEEEKEAYDDEEEEEPEESPRKPSKESSRAREEKVSKTEIKSKDDDDDDEKRPPAKEEPAVQPTKFTFYVPATEAPIPDESNATMVTVFVLIILCIAVSGIVWKFQLHKKLVRSNYDTVAGG